MLSRLAIGLSLVSFAPALAVAQEVAIEHKQVGCIVVGKYPKLGACFAPVSQLARGRVYFRPEGTPSWYYVEMASDQPCHAGILPKPGKKLVGQKIEYYVEGQDRSFNAARTTEFTPVVVESQAECDKDVPIAPFLTNANVAVFPALPAGFAAGGIGAATTAAVVAGGAAVVGTTAAVVASSNDDNATTTTLAIGVNTTTTVAAATTTTTSPTTTTTLPRTNRAPQAVLTTSPDPPEGPGPLTVTFNMCGSRDPDGDPLTFFFEFGDGARASGTDCSRSHTYSASFRATGSAVTRRYTFDGSAVDPGGLSQSRTREVVATDPTPPPTTTVTCGAPTVSIVQPMPSTSFLLRDAAARPSYCADDVPIDADATNADKVTFTAEYLGFGCGYTPIAAGSKDVFPPDFSSSMDVSATATNGCFRFRATAVNCKGATATATVNNVDVFNCGYFRAAGAPKAGAPRTAGWSSDLSVPGGRLQLVANGALAAFPGRGRSYGALVVKEGENHVEAVLVESEGKGGLWRFDFMGSRSVDLTSLRVAAGEVVHVGANTVTFRLNGMPGERIAFTFHR